MPRAHAREGLLWLLAFLPTALGNAFSDYITTVLPVIIGGLADDSDPVREVALRAGQVIVKHFAATHTGILLPSLQAGMFDENWRIRQSSVMLLGDLMFAISGAKAVGVVEDEDDDSGLGTDAFNAAIVAQLGMETRNDVFASLYIMRNDISAVVRQSALQVWKTVVVNTPRTLKSILPVLMTQVIASLAATNPDKREVGGRCLGDVVRKLGERVLQDVVPILRRGLQSDVAEKRQGVCLGLSEVIAACNKRQLEEYMSVVVPAVERALCDSDTEVRYVLLRACGEVSSKCALLSPVCVCGCVAVAMAACMAVYCLSVSLPPRRLLVCSAPWAPARWMTSCRAC